MSLNTIEENNVPLRNLFCYIRDLYNTAEPVYNFEKESQNPKVRNSTYWHICDLLKLYNITKKKGIQEFQLQLEDDSEPIIKLKRTVIPELRIPDEINEWVVINDNGGTPPTLLKKDTLERHNVPFEKSIKRVEEYNSHKEFTENTSLITSEKDITTPSLLKGWVRYENEDGKLVVRKEFYGTEVEKFDNDKNRTKVFNTFKKDFDDYYNKYFIPLKLNKVYDSFHTLQYELKGKDTKKLYISFGLISGKIGGETYRNFLFNIPLRISLKSQEIKIELDVFANRIFCEQFFTELFDYHFRNEGSAIVELKKKEVVENVDEFNSRLLEFSFSTEHIREIYYESAVKMISMFPAKIIKFFNEEQLNYEFCSEIDDKNITFSFSPIIQTKIIESQIMVSKDATNIIKKLSELENEGRLSEVPDFFKKLFDVGNNNNVYQSELENSEADGNQQTESSSVTSNYPRFLFPLAYNDEQLEIVKRLYEQDAVTVKGPPGTGKSHTIANIISHFVAQGKSILVVSQNSKALSVLMDKLPSEIQKLAISLVNESKDNKILKNAVESILSRLNNRYEEGEIQRKEEELRQLDIKYKSMLEKVYNLIRLNNTTFKIFNPYKGVTEEKTASGWAEYIFNNNYNISFIEDRIQHEQTTDWVSEKIMDFIKESNGFTLDNFGLVNYEFHDDSFFPSVQEFRKIEDRINDILNLIDPSAYEGIDYKQLDDKFASQLKSFCDKFEKLNNSTIAGAVIKHHDFNLSLLENLLVSYKSVREEIELINGKLIEFNIDLTPLESVDADILKQNINKLILKYNEKETLNILQKGLLPADLKKFFSCKVNYIPVDTLTQLKTLELCITLQVSNKKLNIVFGNYLNKLGVKTNIEFTRVYDELSIVVSFIKQLESFNGVLTNKGFTRLKYPNEHFENKLDYIKNVKYYSAFKGLRRDLEQKINMINSFEKMHPSVNKIVNYLDNLDMVSYEAELGRYREIRGKSTQSHKVHGLYNDIFKAVPVTAQRLKNDIVSGNVINIDRNQIEEELFYLKVEDFLQSITSKTNSVYNILNELQTIKKNVESKTADLIAYKTWYNKSKKVNDIQKSALTAWLNDLINIGRGYGKNTARNTQSAIQNMQIAKGAVPIWIMRIETAINFLPDVSIGQFDLLIIDEASQCDISCLNLIFRCKKCIVVGDENQTSVSTNASAFPIDRTNVMLDRYLYSHQFKQQFNVNNKNNSIYTLSGVIYPNIVSLFEHFRCLPEIIGFSNKHIYNYDIIPLKTATEYKYGNPIEIHYVEDDIEDDEKPNIVNKSIEIIESFIHGYNKGEISCIPTIGIITLDSSNIRHQQRLIKKIASNETIKAYEDRLELLIGTSREFQGDERDVIILTTTTSHSINDKFEIKPPKAIMSEEYSRIYNVASSRAQEKCILLHSICQEAIGMMNPDCYRKRLIDYYSECQSGTLRVESRKLDELLRQVDANSGDFEKTVCKALYNNGFSDSIYPQFKVGKYQIDFGIIKNNRKLAIECDGVSVHSGFDKIREDINRQIVLERAGWKFFRIQSTEWFYKNENVSRRLFNWLTENVG